MKDLLKNKTGANYFENDFAAYLKKDYILYIRFKENLSLTYAAAKKIVRDRLRFQAHSAYHVICDVSGIRTIDEAARDYLATKGSYQLKAAALVTGKRTLYKMGTYYKVFNTPKILTEVFSTLEEADAYIKNLTAKP